MANKKRLIDANALMDSHWWESLTDDFDKARARIIVMSAPTVDAVEVVHGRWEKAEYCGFVRCDQCKDVYIDESWLDDGRWKYCPNCGASMMAGESNVPRMDGDGNG
jgi:hypothetical protein